MGAPPRSRAVDSREAEKAKLTLGTCGCYLGIGPSSECFVQAAYQIFIAKGFAQKSYRPGAERAASCLHFRERSDKDNGNAVPLGDEIAQ